MRKVSQGKGLIFSVVLFIIKGKRGKKWWKVGHAEIWSAPAWQRKSESLRAGPIAAAMEELEF